MQCPGTWFRSVMSGLHDFARPRTVEVLVNLNTEMGIHCTYEPAANPQRLVVHGLVVQPHVGPGLFHDVASGNQGKAGAEARTVRARNLPMLERRPQRVLGGLDRLSVRGVEVVSAGLCADVAAAWLQRSVSENGSVGGCGHRIECDLHRIWNF